MVENRAGAGGAIAAHHVYSAAPDGHTLLYAISGIVLNSLLDENFRYALDADFMPVSQIARAQLALVVPSSIGIRQISDFHPVLRENIRLANFGLVGTYSSLALFGANFSRELDLDAQEIPFPGSTDILNELVARRLGYAFIDVHGALPFVREGQLRAIAVAGDARSPVLPDVPTLAELGFAGYEPQSWFGLFAPLDTEPYIVQKISADVREAIESTEVSNMLRSAGSLPVPSTPPEFTDFIAVQIDGWSTLARNVGLAVKDQANR